MNIFDTYSTTLSSPIKGVLRLLMSSIAALTAAQKFIHPQISKFVAPLRDFDEDKVSKLSIKSQV